MNTGLDWPSELVGRIRNQQKTKDDDLLSVNVRRAHGQIVRLCFTRKEVDRASDEELRAMVIEWESMVPHDRKFEWFVFYK